MWRYTASSIPTLTTRITRKKRPIYFSRRTPLNFFAAFVFEAGFFTVMNSPGVFVRLVQAVAPASLVLSCVRFLTAPLRAFSPFGLFTAIGASSFCTQRLSALNSSEAGTACVAESCRGLKMGFGKGALRWLIGFPLPIILLLALFMNGCTPGERKVIGCDREP